MKVSVILPAKNEALSLSRLLPKIKSMYPEFEVLVVDDGSSDNTRGVCEDHSVLVMSNPYSMGNGAAIKRGAKAASGDVLVFMDADGQHNPVEISRLVSKLQEGYDMVVGSEIDHPKLASAENGLT